ncbi:hypothetical protein F4803DRAFT_567208 [Xylaria telfairii]|nr:hypothetical protein F4803DRAFT_567208 [Xylaria telfairii]
MAPTAEKATSEPQENAGWVRVRRSKVAKKRSPKKPRRRPCDPPTISLDDVKRDYDHYVGVWKASSAYARLRELLSSHAACATVTKAICFGLGSFDPEDNVFALKRNSHTQLAAFLTIVEHLQSKTNTRIRCIFQDPVFNAVDKAFLTGLGHEVVQSPAGFKLVDANTLTFGIHTYRDVCTSIVATHLPAIYIGTSYETWEGNPNSDEETMKSMARLKEMKDLSICVRFPDYESEYIFEPTAIHWRQRDRM